MGNVNTEN